MGGKRNGAGRPPKPVEQKILEGTFRKDRDAGKPVADGPDTAAWPKPPRHLSRDERRLWRELEPHCKGWTMPSDWVALNGVVSLMAAVVRLQALQRAPLAVVAETIKGLAGRSDAEREDAERSILTGLGEALADGTLERRELAAWRELRGWVQLTGLSPVDRARLRVGDDDGAGRSAASSKPEPASVNRFFSKA